MVVSVLAWDQAEHSLQMEEGKAGKTGEEQRTYYHGGDRRWRPCRDRRDQDYARSTLRNDVEHPRFLPFLPVLGDES